MNAPFYDGDFDVPQQVGPVVPSIDEATRGKISRATYWQRASLYEPLPRGSTAAGIDGILVLQPEPRCIGADIVEFDLVYAEVPAPRVEPEAYVYNFQYVINQSLVDIPQSLTSRIFFRYVHVADPTTIGLAVAWKGVTAGDAIIFLGERPQKNTWVLAEDEQLSRHLGDIWEIRARKIFYREFGST